MVDALPLLHAENSAGVFDGAVFTTNEDVVELAFRGAFPLHSNLGLLSPVSVPGAEKWSEVVTITPTSLVDYGRAREFLDTIVGFRTVAKAPGVGMSYSMCSEEDLVNHHKRLQDGLDGKCQGPRPLQPPGVIPA
jgi:hypothetical protein